MPGPLDWSSVHNFGGGLHEPFPVQCCLAWNPVPRHFSAFRERTPKTMPSWSDFTYPFVHWSGAPAPTGGGSSPSFGFSRRWALCGFLMSRPLAIVMGLFIFEEDSQTILACSTFTWSFCVVIPGFKRVPVDHWHGSFGSQLYQQRQSHPFWQCPTRSKQMLTSVAVTLILENGNGIILTPPSNIGSCDQSESLTQ